MLRTFCRRATVAAAFLLAACSDKATAPVASTVILTPAASGALASIGETRAITVVVASSNGTPITGSVVTFSSSNTAVATVTGSGSTATVTAVGNGTTTISASVGTTVKGTLDVTVAQKLATLSLPAATPSIAIGATTTLTGSALDAKGVAIAGVSGVTFTTAAARTAVVSSTGVVTAIAPGTVVVTGSLTRDGVTATANTNVTVTAPTTGFLALLNGANERPTMNSATSTGAAVFTVNGTTVNYTVTYQGLASGPTGLHIHSPAGVNGAAGVSIDLLGTAQLPTTGVLTGTFTAAAIRTTGVSLDSMLVLFRTGNAYANVHSTMFPGGEIRGQLATP